MLQLPDDFGRGAIRHHAGRYGFGDHRSGAEHLTGLPGLQLPVVAPGCTPVWHLFVVLTPDRDRLQAWLAEQGIQTMIHYPIPPHLQQAYNSLNYPEGRFPVAERLARECLSLPLYPGLAQAEYICDMMQEWFLR